MKRSKVFVLLKYDFYPIIIGLLPCIITICYIYGLGKSDFTTFLKVDYVVSWGNIFAVFFGGLFLFVFPNVFLVSILFKNKFNIIENLVLSFVLGLSISTLIGLLLKHLNLGYDKKNLFLAYCVVYLSLYISLRFFKLRFHFISKMKFRSYLNYEYAISSILLLLAIVLNCHIILKTRSSSFKLYGDELIHLHMVFSSILDGPFYEKLFCYSKFFPNWYPSGFHNWIVILTKISNVQITEIYRYVPLIICIIWNLALYLLAKKVTRNNIVASIIVLFSSGITGGYTSEKLIPFILFFNPWALGWIFTCVLLFLTFELLQYKQYRYSIVIGFVLGASILYQPLILYRMPQAVIPFLIIYHLSKRNISKKELITYVLVAIIALSFVSLWALPLWYKYGFWSKMSFSEMQDIYGNKIPYMIEWLNFRLKYIPTPVEMERQIRLNVDNLLYCFSILGIFVIFIQRKTIERLFTLIWCFSIFPMLYFSLSTRPLRLFEYYFFSIILIAGIGIAFWMKNLYKTSTSRKLIVTYLTIIFMLCFYYHISFLTYKFNLYNITFYSKKYHASIEENNSYSKNLYNVYVSDRKIKNGLTERWKSLKNFLTTLNPDFFEIFIKGVREEN